MLQPLRLKAQKLATALKCYFPLLNLEQLAVFNKYTMLSLCMFFPSVINAQAQQADSLKQIPYSHYQASSEVDQQYDYKTFSKNNAKSFYKTKTGELELQWIAERIYANECASKPENLIHWNTGENFPSLGIGHFIWYRHNQNERFVETFPDMFAFVSQHYAAPLWLSHLPAIDAPWQNKAAFQSFKNTLQYQELQAWLLNTMHLQAHFITQQLIDRFEAFWQIPADQAAFQSNQQNITALFKRMLQFKQGRFALIDYANFKGVGSSKETYQTEQWGLVSVLALMQNESPNILQQDEPFILQSFVTAAKQRLTNRVALSPKERGEKRWLKGWFKRLDGYLLE